jgi:hypothetical protein
MSERTDRAFGIAGGAAALGVAADLLLRDAGGGVNVAVWGVALAATPLVLARRQGVKLSRGASGLLGFAAVFLSFWAWRASPALRLLDLLSAASLVALASWRTAGRRRREGRTLDCAERAITAGLNACLGPPLLAASDISWSRVRGAWGFTVLRTCVGLGLALLLLVVFVPFLASADLVFSKGVADFLTFLVEIDLLAHVAFVAVFTWLAAGVLRDALVPQPSGYLDWSRPKGFGLGLLEVAIPLGALSALFLTFLAVQVRYLFGGAALVRVRPGLTYAEYARRGFFELVAVAALVVPLLLVADWVLLRKRPRDTRVFRALGGSLVGMMLVLLVSAAERMRLYVDAYGWTELRFYTSAAMVWLAVVVASLAPTVLAGRRDRFPFVSLASALVLVAVLNAVNPAARIVTANARMAASGRPFDAAYASRLGTDAVPALVEALPRLPLGARETARGLILDRERSRETDGWRGWSWSGYAATRAVLSLER